jgi:hypothetical protein
MDRKNMKLPDCSTRRKRRAALIFTLDILEQISLGEATYRDNMPLNLQGSDAYDFADYNVSLLEEAIDVLHSVYDD